MTGSQQEEVIERVTEEESWKKRRRKQGEGWDVKERDRQIERTCTFSVIKTILKRGYEKKEKDRKHVSEGKKESSEQINIQQLIGTEGVCDAASRGRTAAV